MSKVVKMLGDKKDFKSICQGLLLENPNLYFNLNGEVLQIVENFNCEMEYVGEVFITNDTVKEQYRDKVILIEKNPGPSGEVKMPPTVKAKAISNDLRYYNGMLEVVLFLK